MIDIHSYPCALAKLQTVQEQICNSYYYFSERTIYKWSKATENSNIKTISNILEIIIASTPVPFVQYVLPVWFVVIFYVLGFSDKLSHQTCIHYISKSASKDYRYYIHMYNNVYICSLPEWHTVMAWQARSWITAGRSMSSGSTMGTSASSIWHNVLAAVNKTFPVLGL